jgi:hypothetical protein
MREAGTFCAVAIFLMVSEIATPPKNKSGGSQRHILR